MQNTPVLCRAVACLRTRAVYVVAVEMIPQKLCYPLTHEQRCAAIVILESKPDGMMCKVLGISKIQGLRWRAKPRSRTEFLVPTNIMC